MLFNNRLSVLIIVINLFIVQMGYSQFYNKEVEATIKLESNDEYVEVTGLAKNKSEINQSLRYELSVIKSGGGNNSKNAQSGRFTLEPHELKELSQTTINITDKSQIIILLLIYNLDDELIGKDRKVINEIAEEQGASDIQDFGEEKKTTEDGISIRGIVTEETKTKAGKDFFNYFYSSYLSNNVNAEQIVVVSELINMGRSTRIEITVDNELVFKFFVQPKDDYLRSMAQAGLMRVSRYIQQKEKNTASIFKY